MIYQEMKKQIQFSLFAFLISIGLIFYSGCRLWFQDENSPGAAGYGEISAIPREDSASREQRFNEFPVETQIEIYLYAEINRSPSDTVFLRYLMRNGETKLMGLAQKINGLDSANAKSVLANAVWWIELDCDCVPNNAEIMKMLENAEPAPSPKDDEGDRFSKRNYSWVLFELQRKQDGGNHDKNASRPNPFSNGNTSGQ